MEPVRRDLKPVTWHGERARNVVKRISCWPVINNDEYIDVSAVVRTNIGAEEVPVTRCFIETLFIALQDDITAMKQEVTRDTKDIRSELHEVGQRVDTLERAGNAREKELEACRHQIFEFQDQKQLQQIQCLQKSTTASGRWQA
ncbi:hypothetical protein NDU88_001293 [Pleurodeles waltl]|uniref:Uncharacterized protein n=1 Tax=Pleurodeles waltl TaxID=8319 RepID=A0AAV7LZ93_PLEWA|nr:hypothetical protein NDU88_001293 [Pleurodeles waltl]